MFGLTLLTTVQLNEICVKSVVMCEIANTSRLMWKKYNILHCTILYNMLHCTIQCSMFGSLSIAANARGHTVSKHSCPMKSSRFKQCEHSILCCSTVHFFAQLEEVCFGILWLLMHERIHGFAMWTWHIISARLRMCPSSTAASAKILWVLHDYK